MDWVYLSPHFDDVALSCGGLVWEQAQAGQAIEVWTICAGEPHPGPLSEFAQWLHGRWGSGASEGGTEAVAHRHAEDLLSCQAMQARPRHFSLPDCIYRTDPVTGAHLYASEQAIFGPIDPREMGLVQTVSREIGQALPDSAQLVCPLSLGGHVDHRLVRAATEALKRPLWYYADYPYVLDQAEQASQETAEMEAVAFPVSSQASQAWEAAVAAHASQTSTFWISAAAMHSALQTYYQRSGGFQLWRYPGEKPK